jgi:hypothetical protein
MKPLRMPLLVATLTLSLGHGRGVQFAIAARATSVKSVKLNIGSNVQCECDNRESKWCMEPHSLDYFMEWEKPSSECYGLLYSQIPLLHHSYSSLMLDVVPPDALYFPRAGGTSDSPIGVNTS